MQQPEKIAYINSQVACALIEMEGMKAENKHREINGLQLKYNEKAFINLLKDYMIGYDTVMRYFNH